VFEDGGQRRDFVHVRDVARANVLAIESVGESAGELTPYNVASGEPHTIQEMAVALAKAYGGPEPVVTGQYRLGDVRHIVASPERAASGLDFRASVPFDEGMAGFAVRNRPE
jgi:dTDP-L-rhamnose 4-epimerase